MTPEERAEKLAAEILRECDRHDAKPIITAAIRDAVKAEKDACELIALRYRDRMADSKRDAADAIATAIRERTP